jgi:transcriptional regulator with XRE-family HTH domain
MLEIKLQTRKEVAVVRLRLRIGEVLQERGVSTRDLADKAGIAVATARALALGENERVDMPVIDRVAAALNVRPLELFKEVEVTDEEESLLNNSSPLPMAA